MIEEDVPEASVPKIYIVEASNNVIIIDGMDLVDKIQIKRDLKTCYKFKVAFANLLIREVKGFKRHLIFDRYLASSLKIEKSVHLEDTLTISLRT